MRENPSESLTKMGNVPTINAIPTRYKGIEFRSRTEARWAVFFDEMGIEWVFEPEGYELIDGKRYLPDFWLPTIWNDGMFFEVKPRASEGWDKAKQLAVMTGKPVAISNGNDLDSDSVDIILTWQDAPGEIESRWDRFGFIRCSCNRATLSYCGHCPRYDRRPCSLHYGKRGISPEEAHDTAMKYRFWNPGGAR